MDSREIWRSLTDTDRQEAAEAFLEDKANFLKIIGPLSRKINFRPVALQRQTRTWQAHKLVALMLTSELAKFLPDLLKSLHLIKRQAMLVAFLDAAGIPNENGMIDGEFASPPSTENLENGLQVLLSRFPTAHILTYFRTLLALESQEGLWQNLPEFIDRLEASQKDNDAETANAANAVDSAAAEEELPESSEEFTSLDNLLIKTIVNAALEIEGAPTREQIDDLTDELLHLSGDRKRTFFHRGFFQAIFNLETSVEHEGENQDSRLWYLAGTVMGWTRNRSPQRIVDLFSADPDLLEESKRDRNRFRMRMLLPVLYPALRDQGMHAAAVGLLENGLSMLEGRKQFALSHEVLGDASGLLRDGDANTALAYLNALHEPNFEEDEVPEPIASFGRRLIRKKAQCLQLMGQMEAAEARLKSLAGFGDFDESIEAATDLGLILGGFESIYSILPGEDAEQRSSTAAALVRGEPYFRNAVSRDSSKGRARNAHFILGVLAAIRPDHDAKEASRHLTIALAGMLRDEEVYRVGNLLDWTKFLLGISLLETCDDSRLKSARDHIRAGLKSEVQFPQSLWLRCLEAASLFDDQSLSVDVAQFLMDHRGKEVFHLIRSSGILSKNPLLLAKYVQWTESAKLSVANQETEWNFILGMALSLDLLTLAERALDELEALAHAWPECADRFLGLIFEANSYSPAWDPIDAEEARLRLFEAMGRFQEAAEILGRRFWVLRAERSPTSRADCEGVLIALQEMGRPPEEVEPLRQSLPEIGDSDEYAVDDSVEAKLREGERVVVLFVGGNETQAKYDATVRDELKSKYPGLEISFEHPGWGSRWANLCDQIEKDLHTFDAIVLSHLVRTNMGRRMRKICNEDTPWFACRGRGAQSIQLSIENAALRSLERRKSGPKI